MKYQSFSLNSVFFESLINDIKKARSRIYIETYIFRNDELGNKIKKILTEKSRQGVDVKLLIDAIGGLSLSEFDFYDLISAGGDIRFFRRLLLFPVNLAKLNNRDHRKIVIIDNDISYIGSTNIDTETSLWREFNLRIDDRGFNDKFSEIFIRQFLISNSLTSDADESTKPFIIKGTEILRAVPFSFNPIRKAFLDLITDAKKEIIIENPYVVFDKKMGVALKRAVRKGVEIKLILPTRSDVTMMNYLNLKYMQKARKMGIKVLCYPKMLHSKIILVDNNKWMFGSANLEYRSMFTQFEIMLKGEGGEIGNSIENHIKESLTETEKHGEEFRRKLTPKEATLSNLLYPIRFLF